MTVSTQDARTRMDAQRLFAIARHWAVDEWGSGWMLLSVAIRRAVVAEHLLEAVTLQDRDAVSDRQVRELLAVVQEMVAEPTGKYL